MTANPFAKAISALVFSVLFVLTAYWLDGGLLVTGVLVILGIAAGLWAIKRAADVVTATRQSGGTTSDESTQETH